MKETRKNQGAKSPRGPGKNKFIILGIIAAIVAGAAYAINRSDNTVDTSFAAIDGIPCETQEYTTFHIHAHIDIFANNQHLGIPAYVGIKNACLYWLHTHTPDGVIHIESPKERDFTVGQFFDIWKSTGKGLPQSDIKPEIFVNGNLVSTDMDNTIMHAHDEIVLVYGNAPQSMPTFYQFPEGE